MRNTVRKKASESVRIDSIGINYCQDGQESKEFTKNAQQIEKRPTDKSFGDNIRNLECFASSFCIEHFGKFKLSIFPKSVGRFSIRWG